MNEKEIKELLERYKKVIERAKKVREEIEKEELYR